MGSMATRTRGLVADRLRPEYPSHLSRRQPPLVAVLPIDMLIGPAGTGDGHLSTRTSEWTRGLLRVFEPGAHIHAVPDPALRKLGLQLRSPAEIAERRGRKRDLTHLIRWAEHTLQTEHPGSEGVLYYSKKSGPL